MNNKPNYYAIVPADVRYDNDLTPNAKLLYAEITALTNANGVCWAGDQYFMKLYNVKRQSIQRWLKSLEDKGYISREVKYKDGTNEIEKRFIRVYTKMIQGYTQYCDKGIHNNDTVNNTSINTTSNTIVERDEIPYKKIIDYLNEQADRDFRNVDSNRKFIKARWNEGYELLDFYKVVDNMVATWGNDPKFKNYLRPQTLFGTKFDSYLNMIVKQKKTQTKNVFGKVI